MSRRPILLVVALAILIGGAVFAQVDRERTLVVAGHTEDGDFFFTVDGEGRNPPIALSPGERVRIQFVNTDTMAHSFHLGEPIHQRTDILHPEGSEALVFTVPEDASGTSRYWCDPHLQRGMIGPLVFGDAADAEALAPEEDARTPSPGAFGAAAALALAGQAARRRR